MEIVPITFRAACEYIVKVHRHHSPPQGHKFSIGLMDGKELIGVAVVGRPVARKLDDGITAEVTRLCTDATKNACSKLYAACAKAAKAMGYVEIITYILKREPGISLKASGWEMMHETPGLSWSVPSRPRQDKHPIEPKIKWRKRL